MNNTILAGDANCCLQESDRTTFTHVKDKSRKAMSDLISMLNLFDVWGSNSVHTSDTEHYTWKDANVKSRLDYILPSKETILNLVNISTKIVISDKIGQRITDHKAFELKCKLCIPMKGPGYYKLNCSLLDNKEYTDLIVKLLKDFTEKREVYTSESEKWESLKREIKYISISFSTKLAKQKRSAISSLEKELQHFNKMSLDANQLQRKETIQSELDMLYNERCNGAKIRSRAKWFDKGEKSNKFFLSLEQHRQTRNVITSLKLENNVKVSSQSGIIQAIGSYYEKLYTCNHDVDKHEMNEYINENSIDNEINDEDRAMLGKIPSESECHKVLNNMKDNKSPGFDGIPSEFYKFFWEYIKGPYLDMINECWNLEKLPISMKTAIISLIHKSSKRDNLNNYRPISLMNTDYKIVAFVFASRMQKVICKIVDPDQCAYIKKRYIGCNIRNLIDIYEYCEAENEEGALLNIDYAKAFDSVEHDFIFSTLKMFGFGETFIKWINILYAEPIFRVKNNGWISKPYRMERGIRQGCAMSSLLFILVAEILAIKIRLDKNIKGIYVGNVEHKIVQYADDSTIILRDLDSITNVIKKINTFSYFAGPKLNISKTKGIWLGPLKDLGLRRFCNITWTGNPVKCLGIYIGHKRKKCDFLNWNKRLENISNTLNLWKSRDLSLEGKILAIKTMIIIMKGNGNQY